MKRHRLAACAFAAALAAGCAGTPTATVKPTEATVAAHVAEATRLAGTDLKNLMTLCQAAPATRPPQAQVDRGIAAQIARTPPEPGQAFDNLYFVGSAWVSAWVLETSDGVILVDALNNALEAQSLIEGGMRRFGLDPAQIRYLVVTHGHGDHYGGANYFVDKYKTRIVMSDADWTMTATQLEFASAHWGAPPKIDRSRDRGVIAGDSLTLGDSTMTFQSTPGHTKGTISLVFDLKTNGRTHRALLWGGTAFNFGKDLPRLDSYIDATVRMAALAQRENIDVLLSNHPGYDGTVEKLAQRKAQPGNANPFVMGTPAVVRALGVMGECARAQRDRFAMQG